MTDITTALIHHPYKPPAGFAAPQPGVFKASTVMFANVASMRHAEWKDKTAYTYGLHGTPTTYMLEERLCALEGGLQCLLLPSGLAAIANVALSLLQSGDEVLLPDNSYGPNKTLVEGELLTWGISHSTTTRWTRKTSPARSVTKPGWFGLRPLAPSRLSFLICPPWFKFAARVAY